MTSGQKSLPGRALALQVRPARQERRLAQRAAAAHRRRSPTTSAIDPVDAHRGDQPRPGHHLHPDRLAVAGRPSMGSWVAYGLGSENQDLPAFVVLISPERPDQRPAALRPALGQRLPADALPGREAPPRPASRCSTSSNPPGIDRRPAAGGCSTASAGSTPSATPRSGDPEIPTRIAQYEMAYRMQTSVPELTDLSERAGVDVLDLYGPDVRKPGTLRRQLPAGPPPGRARRPVHPALPPGLGPARRPARRASAASATTPTSRPPRWSRTSSSAACSTTRWSSGAASSAGRSTARGP